MIVHTDLDPSHDWKLSYDGPDPHNPAYVCRNCSLVVCTMCPPHENIDYIDAHKPCEGKVNA